MDYSFPRNPSPANRRSYGCRLQSLARAHDSLKESAGFLESAGHHGSLGANVDRLQLTHHPE
jgi:hypothetical protein